MKTLFVILVLLIYLTPATAQQCPCEAGGSQNGKHGSGGDEKAPNAPIPGSLHPDENRSLRPDSIANADLPTNFVDPKKSVDKVEFIVSFHVDSANVTGLHVEFTVGLFDSSIRPTYTIKFFNP